jgi:uncharacterized protein
MKLDIKDLRICKTIASKARGEMFRISPKYLLMIFDNEEIVALHMLFVFFPIEVIFLDKNQTIVEMKKKFLPFTFYTPSKKAKFVLETPTGFIEKKRLKVGNRLDFQQSL